MRERGGRRAICNHRVRRATVKLTEALLWLRLQALAEDAARLFPGLAELSRPVG